MATDQNKAILFDMDGVIVLTESIKAEAHAATISELGGSVSVNLYRKMLGESHESIRTAFLEAAGVQVDPLVYTKIYRKIYHSLLDQKLKIRPGAKELVEELKQQRFLLAIVSSSSLSSVSKILAAVGLEKVFDVQITSDDVKKSKPDPEPYLVALQKLAVQPKNAIVFEDSPSGIEAAIHANIRVIGVRHDFNVDHDFEGVTSVVNSFLNTKQVIYLIRANLANSEEKQ